MERLSDFFNFRSYYNLDLRSFGQLCLCLYWILQNYRLIRLDSAAVVQDVSRIKGRRYTVLIRLDSAAVVQDVSRIKERQCSSTGCIKDKG